MAQACWECLCPLPQARLACDACALPRYCSARCRARHAATHAPECGAPWPALLPARAVLAARLARFTAEVRAGASTFPAVGWTIAPGAPHSRGTHWRPSLAG